MDTKRSQAVFATALALALTGVGFWLFGSDNPTFEVGNGLHPVDGPVETRMQHRISRLEDEVRELKDLMSRTRRDIRRPPTRQPEHIGNGNMDEQQRNFAARLSSNFASQPVDTAWARQTRIELEEQLIATAAEQPDFPAPQTARMRCRSTTCRIEAGYPDEDSALYGVQLLQSAFSSSLPSAYQYSVNNPDGSVTIVMYASKGST